MSLNASIDPTKFTRECGFRATLDQYNLEESHSNSTEVIKDRAWQSYTLLNTQIEYFWRW